MLDYEKIQDYQTKLEKHNGMLPLYLMTYIDNGKYINNLKKQGIYYDNVQEEIFKRRRVIQYLSDAELIEYENQELLDWIKKNNQYEDILYK